MNIHDVNSFLLGNQLRFCNRTTQQCCSNSYFSSEESYYRNNALIDGLREQITGTRETLNNINEDLVDCKLPIRACTT